MSRFSDMLRCVAVRTLEDEQLIGAACSGDLELFRYLIESLHSRAPRFNNPHIYYAALQFAALHGHANIVQSFWVSPSYLLINTELMGCWPFRGFEVTSSPIHLAVKEGHEDVVAELLRMLSMMDHFQIHEALPAGPNYKRWKTYFRSLVFWAVRWGHAPIVQLLLTQPLLSKEEIELPLHLAAHHNHLEVLRMLLQECNSKERFSFQDFSLDGLTAVHLAAQSGSKDAVQLLLCDRQMHSPYIPRSRPDLFTPLHMAANSGHEQVVSLLLRDLMPADDLAEADGVISDLLLARDCMGRTALHYAVREGHEGVVQMLLGFARQIGANIASIADHDGLLPLHLAARAGHGGLIRELRSSHEGSINSKAMYAAHMKRRVEMEYMIEREAYVYYNEKGVFPRPRLVDSFFWKTEGFTPLHFATRYGHGADVIELLVQQCADASLTSNVEDHGLVEAASFCKSKIEGEERAMEELRHAWHKGTRPPLRLHIVQWLEDTEIGSVREYWLPRAAITGDLELLKRLLVLFADFQATDGDSIEYDCLALHNKVVKEALQHVVTQGGYNESGVITKELLLHLPAIQRKEAVTFLSEALHNQRFEAAEEILLHVPQVAQLDNVVAREAQRSIGDRSSRKHRKAMERFMMILVTRDGLMGASTVLRNLLPHALNAGLENLVEVILDRPELKRGLYEDRQVYLDCANAILVGAALIAGIAVQGWLQPPLGYSYMYDGKQYVEMQKPLMRIFWKFNNGAFFLAVGALIAGAKGSVPVARDSDILQSVAKVKRAVAVASTFLGGALVCLVVAFSAAGFVVLPPEPSDYRMMRDGLIWGALPCTLALLWFYCSVLPLVVDYIRCVLPYLAALLAAVPPTFKLVFCDTRYCLRGYRWKNVWRKAKSGVRNAASN